MMLLLRFWIVFLIACALSGLGPLHAFDFPGSAHVVTGVATTKDGRPLPHATLYLLGVPPGQSWSTTLGKQTTVVTDGRGHFTWNVPDPVVILPNGGGSPPGCWALATDLADWRLTLRPPPLNDTDFRRHDLLEQTARECTTHWLHTGTHPTLAVVAPDMGQVTMLVRGPTGRLLRDQPVQILIPDMFNYGFGVVIYAGKTDAAGRLRTRWYTGPLRLQILADGVGFASTGTFELLPGQGAAPSLPPLVPFGRISGFVTRQKTPASEGKAGHPATVMLRGFASAEDRRYPQGAPVNANGQWTLTDVLPGKHQVILIVDHAWRAVANVTVDAGESITGIHLTLRTMSMAPPTPSAPPPIKPVDTVVHGTVTDAQGHSVAGAAVYAICTYRNGRPLPKIQNGHRVVEIWSGPILQEVLTTTTDGAGRYLISSQPGQTDYANLIVATHPGFAAVWAPPHARGEDVQGDLVLPPPTTGLTVRVLHRGQPVPDALVRLTAQGGLGRLSRAIFDPYVNTLQSVDRLLAPIARTGPAGRAVFTGLSPGLWGVTAAAGKNAENILVERPWSGEHLKVDAFGTAQGVAVGAGRRSDFILSVFPQPTDISFRVSKPDGVSPIYGLGLQFSRAPTPTPGGMGESPMPDQSGIETLTLPSAGLWHVAQAALPSISVPFDVGDNLFAVSPSVPGRGPVVIRAVRRGPGRIHVRLEDAVGRATHGSVTIRQALEKAEYAVSIDEHGEAMLPDMPAGQYILTVSEPDMAKLPSLDQDDPFPTDAALTGVTALPSQTITVESGAETRAVFRPQLQGYVHGWLRMHGSFKDYILRQRSSSTASRRVDYVTGEFVAGPFPPGPALLSLEHRWTTWDEPLLQWQAQVGIMAGRVTSMNLTPEDKTLLLVGDPAPLLIMISMSGSASDKPLSGTVFLPDGRTPAWGAQVALLKPRLGGEIKMAQADASGRLTENDDWDYNPPPALPPGSPTVPVLVAWLPGANGAVVSPYVPGQAVRLTLPPPLSVRGRVTVNGQSVAAIDSSFRVLAAFQGHGQLSRFLNVDVTAQADGSFVLPGLTPGTYQVQAARDDIWVSPTRTVRVGEGGIVSDLTLDIPAPGLALDLRVTDKAGRPLPGARLALDLAQGPLTDQLWPKSLATDGAGFLHLEGLAAGPVRLTVFASPSAAVIPADKEPTPFTTLVLDVPPFLADAAPLQRTIHP